MISMSLTVPFEWGGGVGNSLKMSSPDSGVDFRVYRTEDLCLGEEIKAELRKEK